MSRKLDIGQISPEWHSPAQDLSAYLDPWINVTSDQVIKSLYISMTYLTLATFRMIHKMQTDMIHRNYSYIMEKG